MKESELEEIALKLLARSEERIDRTNEMVMKLAESAENNTRMLNRVVDEYCKQLAAVQNARDSILEQNKILLSLIQQMMNPSQNTTNVNIKKQ